MLLADTYQERIDFLKYLPGTHCGECGATTCEEFIKGLKEGEKNLEDCPGIPASYYYPFHIALDADNILPRFACVTDPRPGPTGLAEINTPGEKSPILISGNHIHTQDVMMSVLSTTRSPFFLLFTDTRGNTVDMAVIYNTMTAEQIRKDVQSSGVFEKSHHQNIIIPGLAAPIGHELKQSTDWNVIVGPVCAAELPLFFADSWLPPGA
jgi:CO dehydrogenase/acetyl-CoA synthase gamma subunit (corrinoid Fe-S protein)